MLLKGLEITNNKGEVLNLPFESNFLGFLVREITGLDPVKAVIVSSSFANMDGQQYHSSRREVRDIAITLGLDPNYAVMSVEELRRILYLYLMPKSVAKLRFHLYDRLTLDLLKQNLYVEISGVVETFDAPLFTDKPIATINITCFNPDFVDPIVKTWYNITVPDLSESTLEYEGSVDTGVVFTLLPDRNINEFSIYHRPADQSLRVVDFSLPMVAGDTLKISSVKGDKYAIFTHLGVESSVLYAISPQSAWLELQQGDNSIRVYAGGAPIPYTIEYTDKYGGL